MIRNAVGWTALLLFLASALSACASGSVPSPQYFVSRQDDVIACMHGGLYTAGTP